MKTATMIRNAAILLLLALGVTACDKDKDDDNGPDIKPVASFSSPDTADIGETVQFINLSKNAETYTWSFGDGGISTQEEPTHVYNKQGKYKISLTAYDADSDTNRIAKDILIKAFCMDCFCYNLYTLDTTVFYPAYCGSFAYIDGIADSLETVCFAMDSMDFKCVQYNRFD